MSKPALLDYAARWWMRLFLAMFFLLLYAPIVILIIFSFNDSKRNIVWRGATGKYYAKAWANDSLIEAFINSLTIAVANMIVGTLLGVITAILLWRFRFPAKKAVEGVLALPIVIPEICMGVAMLVFFNKWWPNNLIWPLNLVNIIIAHVTFTFPFVAVIVRGQLAGLNREFELAAMDLGASEWRAMIDVLLPQIKPSIIAGALIAFTLSLEDFVITYFTAGPDSITLPVKINSMVRFSVTPEVNAASTILIIITIVAVWLAMRIQKEKTNG
ncbi:MAG: ABC transporter permease [Proteobacteria bacterium]|nr:ABC transporter permease [Pseudomonadota bacterium]